ncbi:GNAT family N-acetyltransferase [Paucibacter sp. PLA-PC-4]|uniref:GNAT family N-acetyltransferase n=1 Tax=Paucibacter sp. PLA-PC-4 TaxID=2993655 RepID=UPI002248AA98|nr:GNAT family N-acetyltransferase [Paucibacter sp. PLA-PC-4]MCX2860508.1 GNAT family N-acetyltransferase [Paucibacter sp. PLA-PC-4]
MNTRPALTLRDVDPCGADALALLREAALEARALYPELIRADAPMPGNTPTPPRGLYLLAYAPDGQALGCGAFRPLDEDSAEIRRMYVLKAARRCGVAWALLERLQAEARALSYRRLLLETGNKQTPAMALYQRFGFVPMPAFGEYVNDPSSRCFEKALA